ncbi:hypothetical protein Tco_1423158 [Tanacetum coccineum]
MSSSNSNNIKKTFNPNTIRGMQIPNDLLTDEIKETQGYKDCVVAYEGVEVPMIQPELVESTQRTIRTPRATRTPRINVVKQENKGKQIEIVDDDEKNDVDKHGDANIDEDNDDDYDNDDDDHTDHSLIRS